MTDKQKQFKSMVVMFIATEKVLQEQTIDNKAAEIRSLPSFSSLTDDDVNEVCAEIKSEFSIKLDTGVLIEEKGHEKWFLAKKAQLDMKYWERYRKYLLNDKGFSTNVVNTMDDVLDTLTDLLGDPARDVVYKRRGLIIGDVQSGKTANYTGLICKGVDAGYKVIVLLTGTIERLRQQTQQRIDEGFVGADSDAMMKQKPEQLIVGVGKYDSSIRPMVLTSTSSDFKQQNATNLNFDLRNINGPVIFVVKKNSSVLKRLNKWLKTFNQNGDQLINHSLMVIDDESDNASVNTRDNPDDTPTAINGQIRELLKSFTKSSYVGFTATPFANIFIDPDSFNDMVAEDLFPKNYIYSLSAPTNYIGARNIFDENGANRNMIVEITSDTSNPGSIAAILPMKHKSSALVSNIPDDMKTAVAAFMLANVIEDLDKKIGNHRSMLINVSTFTNVQNQIAALVNEFLKEMQAACRNYSQLSPEAALESPYIQKLKDTYEEIYSDITYDWPVIQQHLHQSCAGIIVQVFNQRSGQNFSYDDYKDGLRVIAVGGMSLSRGLTLEGLVISYFYRNSKMYDTLMQMGRWFGYRPGYEKLCRIWMTDESIEWYRHISQATDELRREVESYHDTGLTPMDFGLRVRSDITALLVTARNKMRSTESRECIISLSGVCIETPEIYSDQQKNEQNRSAIKQFIKELFDHGYTLEPGKKPGFKDIPKQYVMGLLDTLDISPKNENFNVSTISKFIGDYRGPELNNWDIAFATGSSDEEYSFDGLLNSYNMPLRNFSVENEGKILKMSGSKRKLSAMTDGRYGLDDSEYEKIKEMLARNNTAMRQEHFFINVPRNPLLVIYAVKLRYNENPERDSELTKNEAPHFSGKTVYGFEIGIPTLSDYETKYARYVLNKIAIQQMFEGEYDDIDVED